jgi:hypothetical protein
MAYKFTDDDRDKDIVTHDGTRVGTVDRVENDRARVRWNDDDESLTDKVKDMLGWGDDDDNREIRGEHVHESTNDRIRLREH